MFDTVSINELRKLIPTISKQDSKYPNRHITPIIQSEAGCGKTSILNMLKEDLGEDKYDFIYIDCPVMDYSDVQMTIPNHENESLKPYTGSVWKMDSPKPKVILGDGMLAHAGNRVCRIQMKKPSTDEWLDWANNNNINAYIKSFVKMNPKCLASYRDEGEEENPYIFNPKKSQLSFASPRSIAKLSVIVDNKHLFEDDTVRNAMAGTVGASFAGDFQAILSMESEIPDFLDILKNPEQEDMPEGTQAQQIIMYQAVDRIKSHDDCSNFMKFVRRVPHKEIQAIFFSMILKNKKTVGIASRNKDITQWAKDNSFIYN